MLKNVKHYFLNVMKSFNCKSWALKPMVYFGLAVSCTGHARVLQALNGGNLVCTVKVDQPEGCACDHFLVEVEDGLLIDNGGLAHHQDTKMAVGDVIDFGNGDYKVVQIEKEWKSFNINSLDDLIGNVYKHA